MRLIAHPFALFLVGLAAFCTVCGLTASHLSRERALLQVDLVLDCALFAEEDDPCGY